MHALSWNKWLYCNNPFYPSRFATKAIKVGSIPLGGNNPIRIQSMTNTATNNTQESVTQAIRIFDAGADYVRFTASSSKEAENLKEIRTSLKKRGYTKPIIADVHFNPKAAEIAAQYVEKVRINPGNFMDKKKFSHIEYTDVTYAEEIKKLDAQFSHFLSICKTNATSIRIGTNHGSLSDRIMSRYGDTPKGMVEATMEFLRIAKKENFNDVVISLKSSNTRVMVQAYRLMVNQMVREHMQFPLHLGVTEAGEGEDGRIKSAVGIGGLLMDGIGDTIRVSLTESPEKEIPVAQKLLENIELNNMQVNEKFTKSYLRSPFDFYRRETLVTGKTGGSNLPVVILDLCAYDNFNLEDLGLQTKNGTIQKTSASPDYLLVNYPIRELEDLFDFVIPAAYWQNNYNSKQHIFPLISLNDDTFRSPEQTVFLKLTCKEAEQLKKEKLTKNTILLLNATHKNKVGSIRKAIADLNAKAIQNPVVLQYDSNQHDFEHFQLQSAAEAGILFVDGLLDGLMLRNKNFQLTQIRQLSFNILQATRSRMVKTEYISCPSCGRTQFDIEKITAEIRAKTSHLSGLKIGIMGCIVNGPGEMADADYGYVGTSKGEVTIYKQKEIIRKNVPSEKAVDALIEVIKSFGDWKEPD